MIAGRLSDLARTIEEAAVPGWLRDYIDKHRNEIIFDLKTSGICRIPIPEGGVIEIRSQR